MSRRAAGLKAWVLQRVTAVYLALFATYLILKFGFAVPANHAELVNWASTPWVALGLLVFVPVTLSHAWVGFRDLFMDYVRDITLRIIVLTLTAFAFVASGLWAVQAIIVAQVA
jgi:succinate dehydrogenase / fumarate reductase membrane anchor subunit